MEYDFNTIELLSLVWVILIIPMYFAFIWFYDYIEKEMDVRYYGTDSKAMSASVAPVWPLFLLVILMGCVWNFLVKLTYHLRGK